MLEYLFFSLSTNTVEFTLSIYFGVTSTTCARVRNAPWRARGMVTRRDSALVQLVEIARFRRGFRPITARPLLLTNLPSYNNGQRTCSMLDTTYFRRSLCYLDRTNATSDVQIEYSGLTAIAELLCKWNTCISASLVLHFTVNGFCLLKMFLFYLRLIVS